VWSLRAVWGLAVAWWLVAPVEAATFEAYRLNEAGVEEIQRGNLESGIGPLRSGPAVGATGRGDPEESGSGAYCTWRQVTADRTDAACRGAVPAALEADRTEVAGWLGLGDVQLKRRDPRGRSTAFGAPPVWTRTA